MVEQLEKRVKSRFSHRYVHLSAPRDLSAYREVCQNALTPFSADSITEDGKRVWGELLNDLFTLDTFNTHLRNLYYLSKSVRAFHTSMLLPISTLPISGSSISTEDLLHHLAASNALTRLQPPDSKLAALASLSVLQLALLIAAARLTIIHDTEVITFPLAHAEYVSLASKARIAASASGQLAVGGGVGRVWSKEVSRSAWEGLERRKLVLGEGRGGGYRVDVRLEEIGEAEVEIGSAMARWCKEI